MKKDNFEEILTEALRKYIKDTESKAEVVPKVKFSERHEKNMEDIFKAVENGEFGNFETGTTSDLKKNDLIEVNHKKYYFTKFTRIAALILLGLAITLAVTPSMTAWRSEDTEFYGENQDDYGWLLRNDTTEDLESNVENSGEYLEMFEYLPDGFEVKSVKETRTRRHIVIKNGIGDEIILRILNDINRALDVEDEESKIMYIDDIKIKYVKSKKQNAFFWNYNNDEYQLYSEIDFEILYKVLENIKFKNF